MIFGPVTFSNGKQTNEILLSIFSILNAYEIYELWPCLCLCQVDIVPQHGVQIFRSPPRHVRLKTGRESFGPKKQGGCGPYNIRSDVIFTKVQSRLWEISTLCQSSMWAGATVWSSCGKNNIFSDVFCGFFPVQVTVSPGVPPASLFPSVAVWQCHVRWDCQELLYYPAYWWHHTLQAFQILCKRFGVASWMIVCVLQTLEWQWCAVGDSKHFLHRCFGGSWSWSIWPWRR